MRDTRWLCRDETRLLAVVARLGRARGTHSQEDAMHWRRKDSAYAERPLRNSGAEGGFVQPLAPRFRPYRLPTPARNCDVGW